MAFNLEDYDTVASRIDKFWTDHSSGRILTSLVSHADGSYIVMASVFRNEGDQAPAATGLAQENVSSSGVNKTAALENCETSAIGRALANLNYATKNRPSREEMEKSERGEQTSVRKPGVLSARAQAGLARLETIAKIEDPSERITAVAEWKTKAAELGVLEESSMINGTLMTLAKYADQIATGALMAGTVTTPAAS